MSFYGVYRAGTTSGCLKQFSTKASERPIYAPAVSMQCDLCGKDHSFRLDKVYTVNTPSAEKSFSTYCAEHLIERDIQVN